MPNRTSGSTILIVIVSLAAGAALGVTLMRGGSLAPKAARTADNKPNFSGIWQANNEAYWDLQAHEARAGAVTRRGYCPTNESATAARHRAAARGAAAGLRGSAGVFQSAG